MHVWPIYAALTIGTLLLVWRNARVSGQTLVFGGALLIASIWLFSNLCHWWLRPESRIFFPTIDLMSGIAFLMIWRRQREMWALCMSALLAIDGVIHLAYFGAPTADYSVRYRYDLALNMVFLLQLACVTIGSSVQAKTGKAK